MLKAFDGLQKAARSVFAADNLRNISVVQFFTCMKNFGFSFDGRILDGHQREQKESYETQLEGLKLRVDHLQNENNKLQKLFQEKSNVNENIREEVSRLSSENSVRFCFPEFIFYFTAKTACRDSYFSLFYAICRLFQC